MGADVDGWVLRPMEHGDVAAAETLSGAAFEAVDTATRRPGRPEPGHRGPERVARWVTRTARFLETDPGGCWVAEDAAGLVGFATSVRRERLWVLVTFAVRPGSQGRGVGAALLARAETHGAGCDRAMLSASEDQGALRRYWAAGFSLHPQLLLHGRLDRSLLPSVSGLREGTAADRTWMDDLDRVLRGGPHGPDHVSLSEMAPLVVAGDRSGYAYAGPTGPALLAARDEATARDLLVECLARVEDRAGSSVQVGHVTSLNVWAVDVALGLRLALDTQGHLAVRGMAPPTPYVHNGALL
ncbi:GNAT family N-acetyltransferase [Nocardioides sp. P86]|uniref:GNAT family N-acetyltransferase n=1 Tax=Nocardioides sp. P86 TaxID=2939569 RepID=UPI00203D5152|nr:GNAT family N-acetyltransferase [Nocardioides sp. P86]MCM3514117.1 GNAT family N-acetyltransferase [Nocardioides sp. P86]